MPGESTSQPDLIMKSKQPIPVLTTGLILLTLLATASAQSVPKPAPTIHPAIGFSTVGGVVPTDPATDPATGLPISPTTATYPQWVDSRWNDPDIILTNVIYDNRPLSEVAQDLRARFHDTFNIILPMPVDGKDWACDTPIKLQLKNVGAMDVFNAMNLMFENDQTPLRWELTSWGRPLVQLRVLPTATPKPEPAPPPLPAETQRQVIFVGNLLGDETSGGLTMAQIVKTISDIWPTDFGDVNKVISFHKEAQLLVLNGTRPQLDFIQQTLQALGRKADLARPKNNDLKRP